ncbi:hypothetical protein FJZ36_13135 [Candidatus Poribacteria bacterium]|nr:hypothetical protein [Candidatus Poribacteria bacterium]
MPDINVVIDIIVPIGGAILGGGGVGAFISWRIAEWQKKTKRLEIKADLLRYSMAASMEAIRNVQSCFQEASCLLAGNAFQRTLHAQQVGQNYLARWVVDSTQVQSLIAIYFPGSNLLDIWRRHHDAIEAAFAAFSIAPDLVSLGAQTRNTAGVNTSSVGLIGRGRQWHLDLIKRYVGVNTLSDPEWAVLMSGLPTDPAFTASWIKIRQELERKQDKFASYVRRAKLLEFD